jgi:hypothetical protein
MEQCQAAATPQSRPTDVLLAAFPDAQSKAVERLPFTIRRVHTDADMRKAVQVRYAAYLRHIPEFAQTLIEPEQCDYDDDAVILMAESKLDGTPLGSCRIQTNLHQPLSVEDSVALPAWLQGRRLAEVTRLGSGEGRIGRVVKIALIKACFQYCEKNGIEWAMLAARSPLDRQYEQLLFEDVFPDAGFIPMRHASNLPHRVMAFEIETGHARWTKANHPLLKFFSYTRHSDIDITVHNPLRSPVPGLMPAFQDAGEAWFTEKHAAK